ncbi:MAG: hypothetical protein EOP04_24445, partial [Proteobacteria bacterium]
MTLCQLLNDRAGHRFSPLRGSTLLLLLASLTATAAAGDETWINQNIQTALAQGKSEYMIPQGTYILSKPIVVPEGTKNFTLRGAGASKTILKGDNVWTFFGDPFLEGCNELLPGTNMICEDQKLRLEKFWTLTENRFNHDSALTFEEEYRQLFESAVKLRYRSDVPVALLLSGGLDSSAIAKVTDNLIERGELEQNEMQAFVASFPNFEDDETQIAREFVRTCKHIKLHEIVISTADMADNFEDIVFAMDHPLGSFASVAHNNIMRECRSRGIKVVLNGQGSDEAFAGYDRYIS